MLVFRRTVLILGLCSFLNIFSTVGAYRSAAYFEESPIVTDAPVISAIQSDPRNEPSIAVSPVNEQIIVGASKFFDSTDQPVGRTNTRIAYYYSADGGRNWGTGVLSLETPQKIWSRTSAPSIAAD